MHGRHNTQREALAAGARRYNTGQACRNGHVSDRYTRNGACIACALEFRQTASRVLAQRAGAVATGGHVFVVTVPNGRGDEFLVGVGLMMPWARVEDSRKTPTGTLPGHDPAFEPGTPTMSPPPPATFDPDKVT